MTTPNRSAGYRPRPAIDEYGRQTYPALVAKKDVAKIHRQQKRFVHRTPNGFNDPITNYHLVEALLDADPEESFTAGQLASWLNLNTPEILWDAVTIGRMLNTMIEYFIEANGEDLCPIERHRYYDGVFYRTTEGAARHKALKNLMDDLDRLCEAQVREEAKGEIRKRIDSPLMHCASLMDPLARVG